MKRNYFVKLRPFLLVALFSFILIIPQWLSRGIILGTDSVFHYNRFYEAAMQIKHWNFSYFLSIYGFQQSGRIVNAVYGPFFAYFQGLLVLLGHTHLVWLSAGLTLCAGPDCRFLHVCLTQVG